MEFLSIIRRKILSPFATLQLFNLAFVSTKLDESQAGIKIAERSINNLRYAADTSLMAEKWRGTKNTPDEGERGEWKSWLETQHLKN